MYKYRIYGLNVSSNLQLDCYPHEFETADIMITLTDSENEAQHYIDQICEPDEQKKIGTGDGCGTFYFGRDKDIVVYYRDEDYLRRYLIHGLFGFAFSYILRRRNIFFLHGSSVVIDGSAVIIVGSSGAGKSSLAASLVQHGGRILSDDTTRLELGAGAPFVYASYPLRRLYSNTIEHLGLSMEGASAIISREGKFSFKDDDLSVFVNQEAPVKAIVRITAADTNDVRLEREAVKDAILIVCRNVYNYKLINHSEFTVDYLNFSLNVCDRIPIYTLYRPSDTLTVKIQADLILKEFYQKDGL